MKDLYAGMLSFAYPLLEGMKIGVEGESLSPFYEIADQELSCILHHPEISDHNNKARFLLLADYVTSVPFGRTGYLECRRKAEEMGIVLSHLRYEKTAFLLSLAYKKPDPETVAYWDKELGFDISEECKIEETDKEEIRRYFLKDEGWMFDLHSLADIVRLFASFGHELEARFCSPELKNLEAVEKAFEEFGVIVMRLLEEKGFFDLESYLAARFQPQILTSEEETYLERWLTAFQSKEGGNDYIYNKTLKTVVAKEKEKAIAVFVSGSWRPVGSKYQNFDDDEEKISRREAAFLTDGRFTFSSVSLPHF